MDRVERFALSARYAAHTPAPAPSFPSGRPDAACGGECVPAYRDTIVQAVPVFRSHPYIGNGTLSLTVAQIPTGGATFDLTIVL